MTRKIISFSAAALTAVGVFGSGCADDPGGAPAAKARQGDGVIFPEGPSQSCDLNVPLSCDPTTSWSITAAMGANPSAVTRTFTVDRANTARLSATGAQSLVCSATDDFVLTGYLAASVALPRGVTYRITADGKGVQFFQGGEQTLVFASPPPWQGNVCGLTCDRNAALFPGCNRNATASELRQIATVTGPGISRSVTLDGVVDVDRTNASVDGTGQLSVYCKMTLPAGYMSTILDARPDDVIAASGTNFIRGYAFTGQALVNACNTFANEVCVFTGEGSTAGFGDCINGEANQCVSEFQLDDPCAGRACTPCRAVDNDLVCDPGYTCSTVDFCCHANAPH